MTLESLDPSLLYEGAALAAGAAVGWLGAKKWYSTLVTKAEKAVPVLKEAGEALQAVIPILKGTATAEQIETAVKECEDVGLAIEDLIAA
jgi:hypothetical protein